MKGVNNKSKRLLCMMLTAIMVFAVFTAGIGIPVGADPGPTRSIAPDSVCPGEEVNVTIEFIVAPCAFSYLFIRDYVPLGWDVTDMRVNEEANDTLFLTEFNATKGIVLFFWVPIGSGVPVTAEYTLHVPHDAEQGAYILTGELVGWSEGIGSWNDTIQEGTVMVELSYGVNLSVDEEGKTTDANVNATYYITVENTGAIEDTYGLSVPSTETDFARLNKTSVSLGAGESEVVELNVSASSSGSYNTTVRAASAHASDEIRVTTNVSAVYGVDLKVEDGDYAEKTVEPNETASYTLTVKNTGSDSDSYELTVSNISNANTTVLDRYTVPNLAAGTSADVVLNVSDAEGGEYIVNVTATSQGNANDTITTVTRVECRFTIDFDTGYNMISLPVNDTAVKNASSLATEIGENCTQISKWDTVAQQYVTYIPGFPLNDFDVVGGDGYFVKMTDPATVIFTGKGWESPFTISLVTGYNMIGIPVNDTSIINASLLATDIGGNCTQISKWDTVAQQYVTYIPGFPLNDFDVVGGDGYFVKMTDPATVIFEGEAWSD